MKVIYLVSCVAQKLPEAAPAMELYTSQLFRKTRAYIENHHRPGTQVRILSALHGLVHPATHIAPYEKTLHKMPIAQRKEWAEKVFQEIQSDFQVEGCRFVIFAGMKYREFLQPLLQRAGAEVVVPMQGLEIGQQLSWLGKEKHVIHDFD